MVRSRDVVYPPEGSGTSAVETWFNRLNQRLQALAMTSGNAWEPGGRDTPRPDMYQLYRGADRTSPPVPVIARAGRTRGLKLIVRPERLQEERLARQQREGLAPSDDNRRRTFSELMNLWHERYGSRLRFADHPAGRREASAPCPRQVAPRWRCRCAPDAAQLEDREALAVDPESPARVLPSALRGRVDAFGRLVDEPESGQPPRAAEVQGAEAQARDHRCRRRSARPGCARAG